jgi:hypothetical protein
VVLDMVGDIRVACYQLVGAGVSVLHCEHEVCALNTDSLCLCNKMVQGSALVMRVWPLP